MRRRPHARSVIAALAAFVPIFSCASPSLGERARRDDVLHGTSVFTWTYEHDPARLVVWRYPAAAFAAYLRNGRARATGGSIDDACRTTAGAHALLLVVAPERSRTRERALDCGVAVERDRFAVVIAPR